MIRTAFYGRQLETAATTTKRSYVRRFPRAGGLCQRGQLSAFDCRGIRAAFTVILPVISSWNAGETLFRSDLCNADVAMGDLLIHEGALHCAATCGESL